VSNTPASNPPERASDESSVNAHADDPEPCCHRHCDASDEAFQVDVRWDEIVHSASAAISDGQIVEAARQAIESRGLRRGQLGVLITDDAHIHEINRRHLQHDYPTDVISFGYELEHDRVEGELVVSMDTARRVAEASHGDFVLELLLYVVHGSLHVAGMDDQAREDRAAMRRAEREVMRRLGFDLSVAEVDGAIAMSAQDSLSSQGGSER
jgi:probable rRNA maturation factor